MNAVIKRLPVNQFILARAPESFDEDVVMTSPAPVHTALNPCLLEILSNLVYG
jgi:hypothetical protein